MASTGKWGKPFQPGQSGNPSGKPKQDPEAVAILKAASPEAARKLVEMMRSAKKESDQITAADIILNRVLGKPVQQIESETMGAAAFDEIRIVVVKPNDADPS